MAERALWITLPSLAGVIVATAVLQHRTAIAAGVAALPLAAVAITRASDTAIRVQISDGTRARVAWLLLIVAAPPWSNSDISTLGVVQTTGTSKAKAAVLLIALTLAFVSRISRRWTSTQWFLLAYAAIATVGAWLAGGAGSDIARTGRYVILVLAACWVATKLPLRELLELTAYICFSVAAAALAAHLAGLNPYDGNGRLQGYWPQLQANELATFTSFAFLVAVASWATGGWPTRRFGSVAAPCGLVLVLTGSRTGLAAAVLGVIMIVLFRWNLRTAFVVWAGLAAAVTVLLVAPHAFDNLATRGGTASKSTGTLSGRTYGWHAVIHDKRPLSQKIVGKGLSAKTVKIDQAKTGFYGFETGFTNVDGAWFAGYLEAGLAGVSALILAALTALVVSFRSREPAAIAIVVFVCIASFLNDTLNDVSISLVVLAGLAAAGAVVRRDRLVDGEAA